MLTTYEAINGDYYAVCKRLNKDLNLLYFPELDLRYHDVFSDLGKWFAGWNFFLIPR